MRGLDFIFVYIADEFVPSLHGVGLCILNLMDDMHEYMRGLFFLMYCAPTVLLAYIYVRTSQALRPPDGPLSEYRAVVRMRQRNSSASSVERSYSNATTATVCGGAIAGAGGGADAGVGVCAGIGHHYTYSTGTATRSYDLYHAELDVYHEKRNQRNFGSMAAAQSSAMQRHNKANTSGCSNGLAAKQHKLKTLDNGSSMSSLTYCHGNGSLVKNFDSNHFGDSENSSMVNGMLMQIGSEGGSIGLPPYHEGKTPCYTEVLKTPDLSSSDISYNLSCMNSSSNFENELDTIDLLERERNRMDMQELLERQGKTIRERRRLPDIDKLCQRSPKFRSLAASTITLSANMPVFSDPLQTSSETLGTSSTLNGETSSVSSHVIPLDSDKFDIYSRSTIINEHNLDQGISGDFHDSYNPGDAKHALPDSALPTSSPVQYQYTRRLSRKPSHHHQHLSANISSHRLSKRDSFHSIHNNDLIAGAFGEIDPTQPLTKMSIIDNRMLMRRSSGVGGVGGGSGGSSRASGFSSSNRSSMKSRDYSHGSTHSPQPELDFRENIFAEL
uniref:Uncharacterized protein n=1 Tax=Glossina austeni TaxID=7395 RepID=A0A1A9VD72_GLOAU